jgi:adenine-specific DNA methylase
MSESHYLAIIQIGASLILEGIILSMVFSWISNKSQDQQEKTLQNELNNIETQNKFIYEQLQKEIYNCKTELISQIKESTKDIKEIAKDVEK